MLGYGGLLLSGGRAADLLGRRRVFLAALALFAVAALLAAFAVIERRSAGPLVRLGIFRSGALTRANIGAVTLSGSYVAFQFLLTQYLQTLSGWSALSTALAFLPAGVIVAVLSTRMGALAGRFGPARLTVAAFACLVAGYACFLRTGVRPGYPGVILPAVLLIGVAFGTGFTALSLAATAGEVTAATLSSGCPRCPRCPPGGAWPPWPLSSPLAPAARTGSNGP